MVFLRRRSLLLKTVVAVPVVWFLVAVLYSTDKSRPQALHESPPEPAYQAERRPPPRFVAKTPKPIEEPELNLPDPNEMDLRLKGLIILLTF